MLYWCPEEEITMARTAKKPKANVRFETDEAPSRPIGFVESGSALIRDFPQKNAAVAYADIFHADPYERVEMIRHGLPAAAVRDMFETIPIASGDLLKSLRLSPATLSRKIKEDANLSSEDSERVIGMARLIGQVQAMAAESGVADFDAARWTASWLLEPVPALGGARPVDFMDTMEGQGIVSRLLSQMQSGAYA
jgi:putative toxin-antitoxin system antitoxin component (TIGR02293 family)